MRQARNAPVSTFTVLAKAHNFGDLMSGKTRKCFLVIESHGEDANMIRRVFAAIGTCDSFVCRNLSEAKAYIQGAGAYSNRDKYPLPDLVICDLHLGGESGTDFLKWAKSTDDFECPPVIILVESPSQKLEAEARRLGALDIIRKPREFDELKMELTKVVDKFCS